MKKKDALQEFRISTNERKLEWIFDKVYDMHGRISGLEARATFWGGVGAAVVLFLERAVTMCL